jgi:chromosome segregation ATPase
MKRFFLVPVLGIAVLSGCANNAYLQAKERTAAGGELDRQEAAARKALGDEKRRQAELQGRQQGIDAEIARNSQRISALQGDLSRQKAQLATALNGRKITKRQHDQMKRELDGILADTQRADLENQGAAMSKTQGNDAAKQAELAKLEERKRALEKTLSVMTAR